MIYRTWIFKIVLSKWYIVSKDANVILIATSKAQSQNLKYNLEQLGKISNYYFLSDDTCRLSQRVTDRQIEP